MNGVGTIELDVVDKIQLSHEAIVNVLLYDKNGKQLTPKDLSLIKLRPTSLTADLIEVTPIFQTDTDMGQIQYKIKANNIGQATLGFIADGPGRVSKSGIKRITVFPPLTVTPENVTLLVGSVYQILAQGGPQPDTITSFSVNSVEISVVTSNGIIQGRSIGSNRVDVKSLDRVPPSTVYSETFVDVKVVNLQGIRIQSPLTRLQVKNEMPLWILGIGAESELEPTILLGGKSPIANFQWQISNRDIADIHTVFKVCYSFFLLVM